MSAIIDDIDIIQFPRVDGISGKVIDVGHHNGTTLSEIITGMGADSTTVSINVHNCAKLKILDGLDEFPQLKVLMLIDCNLLSDITPISQLKNLEALSVSGSMITDLDALDGIATLRIVDASGCSELRDLWGLRNAGSLEFLAVAGSQIASIAPLAACKRLQQLDISSTLVGDLSPLTGNTILECIDANDTPSCECDALITCTGIKRLALNNIRRITPICGLPLLQELYCTNSLFDETNGNMLSTCPELMTAYILDSKGDVMNLPFLDNDSDTEHADDDENNDKEEEKQNAIDIQLAKLLDDDDYSNYGIKVSVPTARDSEEESKESNNNTNKQVVQNAIEEESKDSSHEDLVVKKAD
jgi:hypothetical protein